ncbi:unnamed protein product [Prunus armeniaca]
MSAAIVLVKTAHFNAHGRNCDVQEDDHFGPAGKENKSNIILLDATAWPLSCGYLGVDKGYLMPYFANDAVICLPTNFVPLLMTIDFGRANRQMMLL